MAMKPRVRVGLSSCQRPERQSLGHAKVPRV